MSRPEILKTLVELARDIFDEEELCFDESTPFAQIDAWDSMNHVRMVVAMERAFKVRFNIGELQRVERVSDLVDIICALRGQ